MKKKYRSIVVLCIGIFVMLFFVGSNCPIEDVIGIPCPGCNMFSAMYWLLIKGNLAYAQFYHPAILPLLLYVVIVILLYVRFREGMTKTKSFITVSVVFIVIFIGVYVYRMITIFPSFPMAFNETAILPRLFHLF